MNKPPADFLPTTKEELNLRNISQLDIILISGDTYIDSPYIGVAVIGRALMAAGFTVGIIAQPHIESDQDISRLGEPKLFWGVSAGSVDSMVANYTSLMKPRKSDDFTPGGVNNRRPDRATIVYTNLIRRYFKNTVPIVLGGIEASLRRVAHYDYWSDKLRRSLLLDAKADLIVYGMGEWSTVQLAQNIKKELTNNGKKVNIGKVASSLPGVCYLSTVDPNFYSDSDSDSKPNFPKDFILLPSWEEINSDKRNFTKMFNLFYQNCNPNNACGLYQKYDNRYLVHNPPAPHLKQKELDDIYELPYTRDVHPFYLKGGIVRAQDTIKFSITSHRGCFGECNYCAIAIHQGKTILNRSTESIFKEAQSLSTHPNFKGYISDVGGATANMYGMGCGSSSNCSKKRCLIPNFCSHLKINHQSSLNLLSQLRKISKIKKIFIASGIRIDLIRADLQHGNTYLEEIIEHHLSGQMKIAPEHIDSQVLEKMGRPEVPLLDFKQQFENINRRLGLKQFLTYYFIAAHPGCGIKEMQNLQHFLQHKLKARPEQVQIFTPLPSTYSALMYYTSEEGTQSLLVEKSLKGKQKQKELIISLARPNHEHH